MEGVDWKYVETAPETVWLKDEAERDNEFLAEHKRIFSDPQMLRQKGAFCLANFQTVTEGLAETEQTLFVLASKYMDECTETNLQITYTRSQLLRLIATNQSST